MPDRWGPGKDSWSDRLEGRIFDLLIDGPGGIVVGVDEEMRRRLEVQATTFQKYQVLGREPLKAQGPEDLSVASPPNRCHCRHIVWLARAEKSICS